MKKIILFAFLSLSLLLQTERVTAQTVTTFYVDAQWNGTSAGEDPDGDGPALSFGDDSFSMIQEAIEAIPPGGEVRVLPGTYEEQLVILKTLTLRGTRGESILLAPLDMNFSFFTGVDNYPIIYVGNSEDVTIDGFTIDGQGRGNNQQRFMGISYLNSSGMIRNNQILSVTNTPRDGTQQGIALYLRNVDTLFRHIQVENNQISDFQKNGMAIIGLGLVTDVIGNEVNGSGPINELAQNGIQVSFGATGAIRDNVIQGLWCVSDNCAQTVDDELDGDLASGILIYYPGEQDVLIGANQITDNQCGLCLVGSPFFRVTENDIENSLIGVHVTEKDANADYFGYDEVDSFGAITMNNIVNNDVGVKLQDFVSGLPMPEVDIRLNRFFENRIGLETNISTQAQENWWGCNEGPNEPGCDSTVARADGFIDILPWIIFSWGDWPTEVSVNEQIRIMSDLHFNSDLDDTSFRGFLPDGIGVSFEASGGLLEQNFLNRPTNLGTASLLWNAPSLAQEVTIRSFFDNATLIRQVSVLASDVSLPVLPPVTEEPIGEEAGAIDSIQSEASASSGGCGLIKQ